MHDTADIRAPGIGTYLAFNSSIMTSSEAIRPTFCVAEILKLLLRYVRLWHEPSVCRLYNVVAPYIGRDLNFLAIFLYRL